MSFVHLHVHSEYSLLDGFSNIKKLVARAKEMNMPALGLTDHGTMFGVIDFYQAATAAGIKPIIGIESYLALQGMKSRDPQLDKKPTHILLIAENQVGYQNLLKIASTAQLDGFYYHPRVDHELLAKYSDGLICTSGCMSAEVPRLLQLGNIEMARKQLDWYYEVFGKARFFLELQQHDIKELQEINKNLITLGRRYEAQFVATNDVHYINRQDARLQDILLAIQTGCLLTDPNRMRMTDPSYYLRSPQEMSDLFAEIPEAIRNTLLISERCNVDLGFKGYHLPEFDVPEGHTPESYLRTLCEEGLRRRYGGRVNDPAIRSRLEYELKVIHQMGFDAYFLIVWDLCRYARQEGIWYNARGSAAGSMVAYTLDITMVDPIEHKLIFERFLNPGRISMPDIDLDFRDDLRYKMLEYTAHKYGDDKVAQIITFGTLGARAAIRDVGRVMDIPLGEVDKVAKLIPNIPGKPVDIKQALEEITEFKEIYETTPYLRELIDTAKDMEGVVRNAGTHAAGVIIADKPVSEYIPLHRPTGSSNEESPIKTVSQFEMNVLDSLGLLKVDFLGLATLTIMARACQMIRERHGVDFNLSNIPTDDPETYDLMGRGDTAGVFQVEGQGMRRWLMQMKPKELANVIAMVALFRPGPMDFIPGYIRRMHGEEAVQYRHPALESIFRETYGYPVYQEQLMFAVMDLAGYTAPEADDLRKAISKKLKDKLLKHREKFIAGAVQNGIAEQTAAAIFDEWEEFARYGFNKAHAADYGVIAVQTAYLKAHYGVEYMTAVLSVNKNDTGKVAFYVADCRRMGIPVEPPDINTSQWDFTIEERNEKGQRSSVIHFGLGAVKNVSQGAVEEILKARSAGSFKDLNDFSRRVDLRRVGKRSLECLVKVGALDQFGPRVALLEILDRMISISASHFRAAEVGQMSLFGAHTGVVEEIVLPRTTSEISRREILNWERELIGLYITDHPLSPVMNELTQAVTHFASELPNAAHGDRVRVAGIITRMRHHQSKAGKPMGFATIEDIQGSIELVIFPKTWEKVGEQIVPEKIILVDGKIDANGAEPKVLVDSITTEFSMMVAEPIRSLPVPPVPVEEEWPSDGSRNEMVGEEETTPPPEKVTVEGSESQPISSAPRQVAESKTRFSPPLTNLSPVDLPPEPEYFFDADASREGDAVLFTAEASDGVPEPPDPFPLDWESLFSAPPAISVEKAQVSMVTGGGSSPALPLAAAVKNTARDNQPSSTIPVEPVQPAGAQQPLTPVEPPERPPERPPDRPPIQEQPAAPVRSTGQPINDPDRPPEAVRPTNAGDATTSPHPASAAIWSPAYLVPPQAANEDGIVRMVTVALRSTGDKTRDVLRLRRIHGILTSYPGNDRFAFRVYEHARGYLLEFPNFTVGLCPEMLTRLNQMVGSENVQIEPITFQ